MKLMVTSAFIIAGSERVMADYRAETCDLCIVKRVWLPPSGWVEVDDAEDEGRPCKVYCVKCAMQEVPQPMVVQILIAQGARWHG